MPKVRLVLSVEEELREALRLAAALEGRDMQDIVADWIKTHLPDAVKQVRTRRATQAKSKRDS